MSERDLQDVKVGDLVGSIQRGAFGQKNKWTGTLHEVTKVTAKRFVIIGHWVDKTTGRQPGLHSGYSYVIATSEMIASYRAEQTAIEESKKQHEAFQSRTDYKDASAICYLLSEMKPDSHPLDKLTPAEWADLRRKLGA